MKTITVSNAKELKSAIGSVTGDTTVILKSGNYGALSIDGDTNAALGGNSQLVIKAEDGGAPVVLNGLQARDMNGLVLDGLTFHHLPSSGEGTSTKNFRIENSSDIKVLNSDFFADDAHGHGNFNDGYGTGVGLFVRHCDNVEVAGNTSANFFRGMAFHYTDDLHLHGNNLSKMSSDGLNIAGGTNVLVENNYIHDFDLDNNSNAHADFIQVWTQNIKQPTVNLTVRQNILDIGDGVKTQSVWIRNEAIDKQGAGPEMRFKNFLFENNLIHNAHKHGIAYAHIDGMTIRDNVVVTKVDAMIAPTGQYVTSIREKQSVTGVQIDDNVTTSLLATKFGGTGNTSYKYDSPEYSDYYNNSFRPMLDTAISDWLLTHNGKTIDIGGDVPQPPLSYTEEIPDLTKDENPVTDHQSQDERTPDDDNAGQHIEPFPDSFSGTNVWNLAFLDKANGKNFVEVLTPDGSVKTVTTGYFESSLRLKNEGLVITAEADSNGTNAKVSSLGNGISVRSADDGHAGRRTIENDEKLKFSKYDGSDMQMVEFGFVDVSGSGSISLTFYDDSKIVGQQTLEVDTNGVTGFVENFVAFDEWHLGVTDSLSLSVSNITMYEVA